MKKFGLGQLVGTPGALDVLRAAGVNVFFIVSRHQSGDWGDLGRDDKRANDQALVHGGRILSAYEVGGEKLYVLTEADRSSTCVLKASEY